jgi:hypothetical protein
MDYRASETRMPVSHETLRTARRLKEDAGFDNYDAFIGHLIENFDPEDYTEE